MKSILLLAEAFEGRQVLSNMLRKRGFRVTVAADEAAALIRRRHPFSVSAITGR